MEEYTWLWLAVGCLIAFLIGWWGINWSNYREIKRLREKE